MIGDKDVEHVARLARLALTESERARMREQLSAILQYIDKLKAVDVEGVERRFCSLACEQLYRTYVLPKLQRA